MNEIVDSEIVTHIRTTTRTMRMPNPIDDQIKGVSKGEGATYTATVLYFIKRGLKQYVHKKGTFYCQACGKSFSNKKLHLINVESDEFMICDDCFLSDKYKDFIKRIL